MQSTFLRQNEKGSLCGAGAFDVFVVLKIRTFSWQYESLGGTNAEKRAASDSWQRIYRSNYLDIFKVYVSFLRCCKVAWVLELAFLPVELWWWESCE